MTASRSLRAAAGDLTRPAPVIAAAILAVNDHLLKGSGWLPGAVTGKLSDLAGLFVAPILVVCLVRTAVPVRRDGRTAACALAVVAAVFALLKTWSPFHAAVNGIWGPHVLDPSDLWCLPAVLLAWVWLCDRERHAEAAPRFCSALALAGTLLVCAATPKAPPVPPPSVPMWSVATKPLPLPCGTADVWVSKSGKTGLGVTVRVTPAADQQCDVKITATLRFADRGFTGTHVIAKPASELVDKRDPYDRREPGALAAVYHYIAFELDNEARWNRGDRAATLELAIDAPDASWRRAWKLPATHAYVEFPVDRR